jgi:hypothetical protein
LSVCAALLAIGFGGNTSRSIADEFGRIVGPPLFDVPHSTDTHGVTRLSDREIESLPEVVRGERSALVIATTDQGNLAKLLVSSGLRQQNPGDEKPVVVPVLNLDRYETLDRGDRVTRKARGRDIILFDGFELDLDTGQVVPPGFGGDIGFSSGGKDGPALRASNKNMLYPITRPLAIAAASAARPSSGPAVLPGDFNGRYTLVSNGQTSGALELSVDREGTVSGQFRSDRNGAIYPVSGKIAADLPRRIEFEIKFPRTRQVFDGLLWTEEKNALAGTVAILEHPYSFVAVREGASLVPETLEAPGLPGTSTSLKPSTRVVVLEEAPDRYRLDGAPKSSEELATALTAAAKSPSSAEVLLRVPPSTPFERVQRACRLVRDAGIATIRLAPASHD